MKRRFQCSNDTRWVDNALKSAEDRQQKGIFICRDLAYRLLCECTKLRDLQFGRRLLSLLIHSRLDCVPIFANHLIRLFASCGSLVEADQVFKRVSKLDQHTWNAIINAHAKLGEGERALQLYDKMLYEGVKPDEFTFPSTLKACGSIGALDKGRYIHKQIVEIGLQFDIVVGNALIDMYSKCRSLDEAKEVFDQLPSRDVIAWGAIIEGYAQFGSGHFALHYFDDMQQEGTKPNKVVFLSILKACSSIGNLELGRYMHEQIISYDVCSDIVIGSTLVDMYAKCWSLEEAHTVFGILVNQDVISWSTMISGCVQHGYGYLAIKYFDDMKHDGIRPNKVTYLTILKACSIIGAIEKGRDIHEQIISSGLQYNVLIGSALIDMYARCGSLMEAYKVFDGLPNRDIVAWGAMITAYAQHGQCCLALECFKSMQHEGIKPDIVAWAAMIAAYAQDGKGDLALGCFERMQEETIRPDRVTFLSVLKACSIMGEIERGRLVHEHVIENGLRSDIVIESAIIDMYCKCGSLNEAFEVFQGLSKRDVMSWGAMIGGYVQHGQEIYALQCFEHMKYAGTRPNEVIFVSILKACGSVGAIEHGRHIHLQIVESGLQSDIVGNAIIDMYAKCGSLEEACELFNGLQSQDVVSWGSIIAGYAQHGDAAVVVEYLNNMQDNEKPPDGVIFVSALAAFSRVGLVEEGLWYFESMKKYHGIKPSIIHVACMVDLLGRAGCFNEAQPILKMTADCNIRIWMALLSACKMHNNKELGRYCFDEIMQLDHLHSGAYELLSNIYASVS